MAGAAVGVLATVAALPLIISLTPVDIPRIEEASINLRVLGLCLGVVGITTLIFGLVPAMLLLRTQFTTDLKAGERGSSKGRATRLLRAGGRAKWRWPVRCS